MSDKADAANGMTLGKIRVLMAALIAVSLLIAGIPLILPETPVSKSEGFLELAVISLALACFAIVAAILFILGLRGFKDEFKKTYYFLCLGLIAQATALLSYPAALYVGILDDYLANFIGNVIYLAGTIFMFIGIRLFANLLQVKTWLKNITYVSVATLVLAALLWAVPHTPFSGSELLFDIVQTTNSTEGLLSFFCALLVLAIRKQASLFYDRPLFWLAVALFCNAAGEALYFIAHQAMSPSGVADATITVLSAIAMIASRIFYLVAGYHLIRLTYKEEVLQREASPIDVITYLAALVSKKADIDPMLDELRHITSKLSDNKKMTKEQLYSLSGLYDNLRDYLIHREALLALTEESLDRKLKHKFGAIPFSR